MTSCDWCGHAHPVAQLCAQRPKLTRRSFLFLGAKAAVAVTAAAPLLPWLPAERLGSSFPWDGWDPLFKEMYAPAIIEQLNRPTGLQRFLEDESKWIETGLR